MGPIAFAVAVRIVGPYVLEVDFDDGATRRVDMEPLLGKGVFRPLQDLTFFAQIEVDPVLGTVVWPNGADVSPEFLYYGPEGPPPGYYDPSPDLEDVPEEPAPTLSDSRKASV